MEALHVLLFKDAGHRTKRFERVTNRFQMPLVENPRLFCGFVRGIWKNVPGGKTNVAEFGERDKFFNEGRSALGALSESDGIHLGRSEEHTSELQSQFHLVYPFFFFKNPAPPDISPLPLPDALPISASGINSLMRGDRLSVRFPSRMVFISVDRKSTRLNSSHSSISYILFFFLRTRHPPTSPLFPSPTLFRSRRAG